jgi:hypothetical protein
VWGKARVAREPNSHRCGFVRAVVDPRTQRQGLRGLVTRVHSTRWLFSPSPRTTIIFAPNAIAYQTGHAAVGACRHGGQRPHSGGGCLLPRKILALSDFAERAANARAGGSKIWAHDLPVAPDMQAGKRSCLRQMGYVRAGNDGWCSSMPGCCASICGRRLIDAADAFSRRMWENVIAQHPNPVTEPRKQLMTPQQTDLVRTGFARVQPNADAVAAAFHATQKRHPTPTIGGRTVVTSAACRYAGVSKVNWPRGSSFLFAH